MLTIDEKNSNFDADMTLHAHFLCKECNQIYDIPLADAVMPDSIDGHQISEEHIYYKGICKECLKKMK